MEAFFKDVMESSHGAQYGFLQAAIGTLPNGSVPPTDTGMNQHVLQVLPCFHIPFPRILCYPKKKNSIQGFTVVAIA